MKKIFFFLVSFLFITRVAGQNFEFGKATDPEINMVKYEKDTTANAVVLNEFGKGNINEINGGIRLIYEYHVKIKIFNHKGFENGTVEIHLKNNDDNSLGDEIDNIEGITSYKDDNGVTQVIKLDKKSIYNTRDSKYQSTSKFAMPGLRNGCVIEYRYIVVTPFFDHFHNWQFQGDIPKMYSSFYGRIPAFWRYKISIRGPLKLTKEHSEIETNCFSPRGGKADCVIIDYAMKDIPAFVKEEYMTAPKNFLSAANFELMEFTNPYTGFKTKVSAEWNDVDRLLKDNDALGAQLKKIDFVKDHLPPSIFTITDTLKKAKEVYRWAQNWFKWNNYTGIRTDDGIKKAIDKHSGNIAAINITLINALNAVGINTDAVLISTREHGIINRLYPVIDDFNYLIARASINGNIFFLDATDPLLPFGILPVKCMNDQGRVFSLTKPSFWTDLDTKQTESNTFALDLTLQDDGKLKGTYVHYSKGYSAYTRRKLVKSFNTTEEFVEDLSNRLNKIKFIKSTINNVDSLDENLIEKYEVEINTRIITSKERFALNPYMFEKLNINPFKLAERNYPVDMGNPSENRYILAIHLPAGFTIENKLEGLSLGLPNHGGRFLNQFYQDDSLVTFSNVIQFNRAIYQPAEYPYLKEFYNQVISAEKEELVFKKK